MYKKEGIRTGIGPGNYRTIPWDRSKEITIGGRRVVRNVLLLRAEYFPIFVAVSGVGPFLRGDIGRTLVVDFCDGESIAAFALPEQVGSLFGRAS